jgi:hypothetical protein
VIARISSRLWTSSLHLEDLIGARQPGFKIFHVHATHQIKLFLIGEDALGISARFASWAPGRHFARITFQLESVEVAIDVASANKVNPTPGGFVQNFSPPSTVPV